MKQYVEENTNLLPYEISGDYESPNLIVFLHGYPDSIKLWDKLYINHERSNLILRISYPNYDKRCHEPWGRNFTDMISSIKYTIDYVKNKRKYEVFVVSHDWGAYLTYLFDKTYPKYIKGGITMDIGYQMPQKPYTLLSILLYQVYLAVAFLLPRPIGDALTKRFINYVAAETGYKQTNFDEINASMNYFYYYMFRIGFYQVLFFVSFFLFSNTTLFYYVLVAFLIWKAYYFKSSFPLYKYKPSFPLAFIYGRNKPFMFHSEKMLKYLSVTAKCESVGVDTGHYVMINNEDMINKMIKSRVEDMEDNNKSEGAELD